MGRGFDERGGAHDGSLSRQFWYVCRHASCTYTCTRRTLAEHFCQSVCIRCAAQCSLCGDDSFGFVFSYDLSADAERLRVAAQHHGHGRLHVLAGYRLESLALSPRYAKTGLRSESAAIPIACVSAGYALCICGVPGRSAGTKHRSRI